MLWITTIVLVGCAPEVEHWAMRTPSGRMGVFLRCRDSSDCYEEAGRQCPGGYEVFDRGTGEGRTVLVPVGDVVVAKHTQNTEMLIGCRLRHHEVEE